MINYIPDKLCHILVLKILLIGLALMIANPCKAHKCHFCGENIEWSRTVCNNNPSIARLYCPKCASSIRELSSQRDIRLAGGCNCQGACNCATGLETIHFSAPKVALVLAGITSLAAPQGMKQVAGVLAWFVYTCTLYGALILVEQPDNSYMLTRRQARNAMLEVNTQLNQYPEEKDRINFLSDYFMKLFINIDVQSNLRVGFDKFLTFIHTKWLNSWSTSSPNTGDGDIRSHFLEAFEQLNAETLMNGFIIDRGAIALPSLNSIFSGRREFPSLERELDSIEPYPIHIELSYLRISLYPDGQGAFDMFEASTGVYRHITKDGVMKRISRLCEILGVYIIRHQECTTYK